MPPFFPLILALFALPAPGDEPRPAPSPIRAQLDAATALKEQLTAELVRGYDSIRLENLPEPARAAREEAVEQRYWAAITPAVDGLLAAAEAHPDDPAAVAGLGFVAINARGLEAQPRRALVLLLRDHVRAPDISTVTRTLFVHQDKPEATALLRAVVADNPSRVERGRACHDLAWLLHYRAGLIERRRGSAHAPPPVPHLEGLDPASISAEAEALYERCVAEFAEIPIIGYGAGKTIGDFADGALNDIRHLRVGQPAPEITGRDADGKPLRLSDHRGKVVVLVFSGQWCGPCRANAPYLRDLLTPAAQQAAPCVVLGVNTDATPDPLRQAIAAGEITWSCWFDGGVTGPITMAWGVESFPLIYVLDPQGVIRAKDIRGEVAAAAVATTLAEHPPARQP